MFELIGALLFGVTADSLGDKYEEEVDNFNLHHNGPDRQHQKEMVKKGHEKRRRNTI